MIILSVLLVTISLNQFHCRRLIEDIDNEVSTDPRANLHPLNNQQWVKISSPPVSLVNKKVGAHLELHCVAMGSPPPTIQWYKMNRRITENESFETNIINQGQALAEVASRLVINHLLPLHQDVYRCVAEAGTHVATSASKVIVTNKEGNDMNFTQLLNARILGAHHLPRVTFWAQTYMDVIGTDVILPCKYVGNPRPEVTWYDTDDKPIENDEKYSASQEGELRIRSIEWSDMGTYTCMVKNLVGEDSIETFLYPMQESKK
ncbi:ecdysone-inducible gene L2 isoform X3 [Leptinotarsa decemlineata]|uniref:ecdysone-inducible gene L2 isoform X4 n=1 Tax=Leptinotarsa decemlineata TaxID=7539 RepID=UPI000C252298|nr:neural/ectodermal development factor IMP-L2 [Leptinotarsa decemlineata]